MGIFVQVEARVKRDVRLGDLHPLFVAYVCLRSTARKKIVSEGSRNGIPMRLIDSNLPESHYRAKKLPRPVPHNVAPLPSPPGIPAGPNFQLSAPRISSWGNLARSPAISESHTYVIRCFLRTFGGIVISIRSSSSEFCQLGGGEVSEGLLNSPQFEADR